MELTQNISQDGQTGYIENSLIITGGTMGRGQVEIREVPVSKIKLARNSRLDVSDDEIAGLMQSIKETGLLQPIGVTEDKGGTYEIIYGNRRYLAVSKLGKTKIPAIIHAHKSAMENDLKNLTENIQRRNISLVEAGRYMEILKTQGLSAAEIAIRLGVGKSYVQSCLQAYGDVPKRFRGDIELKFGGDTRKTPGKLSMNAVKSILSAGKQYGNDQKVVEKLFELAKEDDGFIPENATKYAEAIKKGSKQPIKDVARMKRVAVQFWVSEDEWDALYKKQVTDGPFRALNGFFVSVLKGENSVRMKTVKA